MIQMMIEIESSRSGYSSRLWVNPDSMKCVGNSISINGKVIKIVDCFRKNVIVLQLTKDELDMLNKAYNDE